MSTLINSTYSPNRPLARRTPSGWYWFKALFVKECRQVFSLFAVLTLLIPVLQFAILASDSHQRVWNHQVVTFLIPILYAIGCGSVLVSQEKELRTIQWLSSLPAPRRLIVGVKFLVGLLSLGLVWGISLSVGYMTCPELFHSGGTRLEGVAEWGTIYLCNSFFLLVASFVSGWIFSSAWLAIVMVVPMALLPTFLSNIPYLNDSSFMVNNRVWVNGFVYFGSAICLVPMGYYLGKQSFASPASAWGLAFPTRPVPLTNALNLSRDWRPWSLAGSLLWQAAWQNRMVWVVGFATLLMSVVPKLLAVVGIAGKSADDQVAFTVIAYGLLVSWLGASVFASDTTLGRIRFLSDRGVSPRLVWWTRMAAPLLVLVALMTTLWSVTSIYGVDPHRTDSGTYFFLYIGLWFLLFCTSTWCTQWFKSTYVSYPAAPVIGATAGFYLSEGVHTLSGSFPSNFEITLYILGISALALIASRVMTKPWMEGRSDVSTKAKHAAFAMVALCLPVFTVVATILLVPTMSSATRKEMLEVARQTSHLIQSQTRSSELPSEGLMAQTASSGWTDRVAKKLQEAGKAPVYSSLGPRFETQAFLDTALAEACLMKLRLLQDEKNEEWITRYANALVAVAAIVQNLRNEPDLYQQDQADRMEQWLVNELTEPSSREHLDSTVLHSLVEPLANRSKRNEARRSALLASWWLRADSYDLLRSANQHLLIPSTRNLVRTILPSALVAKRNRDEATEVLWKFLHSESRAPDSKPFQGYIALWPEPSIPHGFTIDITDSIFYPGALWFAQWEEDAVRLKNELDQTR